MPEPSIPNPLDGKYQIVRFVGSGAWGEVFEGLNTRIQRRVAIKVLRAELAESLEVVQRFEREALTATKIESEHVIRVYDAGTLPDGRPYMVMEFLDGSDLSRRIEADGALAPEAAVGVCAQAARGLVAAHEAGILHRDLKPENLFLCRTKTGDDLVKIVDFGISKLLTPSVAPARMTQTGAILGSPVYMSPEQARGSRAVDPRSDVYSLGVVLFECLTGKLPFEAESFNELLFKIALEDAPDVRTLRPGLDDGLAELVKTAVCRDPDRRYATAAAFEEALLAWLEARGVDVSMLRSSAPRRAPLRSSPTGGLRSPAERSSAGAISALASTQASPSADAPEPTLSATPTSTPALTDSNVTTSSPTTPVPGKRDRGPLVIGGLAVSLALVAALAFVRGRGGDADAPGPAAETSVPATAAEPPAPAPDPAPEPPAAPAPAETAAPEPEPTPEVAPARPSTAPSRAASTRDPGPRATPRPNVAVAPTAADAGAPAAPRPVSSVGGRAIRTDL